MVTCIACRDASATKVLYYGLPFCLCMVEDCSTLWSRWWLCDMLYMYVLPYSFDFCLYEGSYWRALFYWLFYNNSIEEE